MKNLKREASPLLGLMYEEINGSGYYVLLIVWCCFC